MILDRFRKQPIEVRKYVVDYSARLGASDVITGVEVLVDPSSTPHLGIGGAIHADGKSVLLTVFGGVDGEEYQAAIRTSVDSIGVLWEDELLFIVEEV